MIKTDAQIAHAYRTLDYITSHPERHDQGWWLDLGDDADVSIQYTDLDLDGAEGHCGTTACAAGWTVLLAGHTISEGWKVTALDDEHVHGVAAQILGLTSGEAEALFFDADNLSGVTDAIHSIFGPRPDVTEA